MTYDQEDQAERKRVLQNDARVRNGDTSTYLDHSHSETGGRFAITEHQTITGVVSPAPPPLPANSPWAGRDPVPDEPPLGYRIDDLNSFDPEPPSHSPAAQPTDDPAAPSGAGGPASCGDLVSEAGSSPLPSADGDDLGDPAAAPSSHVVGLKSKRVGSPPFSDDDEPPRAA